MLTVYNMVFVASFCAKCFAVQIILNNFEVLFLSIVEYTMNKISIITTKKFRRMPELISLISIKKVNAVINTIQTCSQRMDFGPKIRLFSKKYLTLHIYMQIV